MKTPLETAIYESGFPMTERERAIAAYFFKVGTEQEVEST